MLSPFHVLQLLCIWPLLLWASLRFKLVRVIILTIMCHAVFRSKTTEDGRKYSANNKLPFRYPVSPTARADLERWTEEQVSLVAFLPFFLSPSLLFFLFSLLFLLLYFLLFYFLSPLPILLPSSFYNCYSLYHVLSICLYSVPLSIYPVLLSVSILFCYLPLLYPVLLSASICSVICLSGLLVCFTDMKSFTRMLS